MSVNRSRGSARVIALAVTLSACTAPAPIDDGTADVMSFDSATQ